MKTRNSWTRTAVGSIVTLTVWLTPEVVFAFDPHSILGLSNALAANGGGTSVFLPFAAKQYQSVVGSSGETVSDRTVNIPFVSNDIPTDLDWTQAGVMWFGTNGQGPNSVNYADARVVYNAAGLHIRVTPVDYYLWYPDNPPDNIDLTRWDSMSVQLDTRLSRNGRPQPTDFQFLTAATMWVNPTKPDQYRRDSRGTGSGWDTAWSAVWTGSYGMVWSSNPGPNENGGTLDYGGDVLFHIPWSSLGVSGPPVSGTDWGLSLTMNDRDGAANDAVVAAQNWPEGADSATPSTWGRLHFGSTPWQRPAVPQTGRTFIRAASPTDTTVQDSWIGGGGTCGGGHEGGSETNHGSDTGLFVANQALSADFPCFSRSYLKFALNGVPRNKVVLAATLTLHHWGNANPSNASPSYIQVFRIAEDWNEMTINWNNAPMAMENALPGTWMNPRTPASQTGSDPYSWDVSRFVAAAYAEGKPLNIAVYSGDTNHDSSKYLVSSNTYDVYSDRRPSLEILWGDQ